MHEDFVSQWLKPQGVRRRIERIGVNKGFVASLAGVNGGRFSQWLNGQVLLTSHAQDAIAEALDCLDDIKENSNSELPLDFNSDYPLLEKMFRKWRAAHTKAALAGTEKEEAAASAGVETNR